MQRVQNLLSVFMRNSLKIMLAILIISSFKIVLSGNFYVENLFTVIMFLFISIGFKFLLKTKNKNLIIYILILGFITRVVWNLKVDTLPYSDFQGMFEKSEYVLNGDYSMFKGSEYYGRFPHLTILVLYFSAIRLLFSDALLAIKSINILLGIASIVFTYLIVKKLFDSDRKGLIAAFIASVYPPFIIYSSIVVGENIAITFFLGSMYLFLCFIKDKSKISILILSGIILSIGNLFRMVGTILLIAYAIYIVIYSENKIKKKMINVFTLILAFYIPLVTISSGLKYSGITEFNLWKGSEPKWTSVLKGTNIEHNGRWNEEDAEIPDKYNYDYEKVEKAAKEIVFERLTTTPTPELAKFYMNKFSNQWTDGDFSGIYWATEARAEKGEDVSFAYYMELYSDILHLLLLVSLMIGLFSKSTKTNRELNLLFILFGGFIMQCLISETQERYAYIASWIFIILPCSLNLSEIKSFKLREKNLRDIKA